uniref:Glutathione S-transferase S2 n=1 Tax=Brachionus rotundiformis TaxID=96890 RepID=A0A3G2JSD9_9BILA|nr:glutathione S-transferase S2 [Brachionus rotundiformis]
MVKYKLYYFNARGRAELIRLILATGAQEFEDIRFEMNDWPEYKKKAPLGQAPFLEMIDDKDRVFRLGQSLSIARYLARTFRIAGVGNEEQAEVESYGDYINDLFNEIVKVRFEKDENLKSKLNTKLYDEIIPKYLHILNDIVTRSSSEYLCNSGITWPDLFLYCTLEWLDERRNALLEKYPRVKALEAKVRGNPKVAEWVINRPKTDF